MEEREMSLKEWCAKLPKLHKVNKELDHLEAERDKLLDFFRKGIKVDAWQDFLNPQYRKKNTEIRLMAHISDYNFFKDLHQFIRKQALEES